MIRKLKQYRIQPQTLVIIAALFMGAWGLWASDAPAEQPVASFPPRIDHHALPVLQPEIEAQVDCGSAPCIALSFDDGPDPEVTPRVLGILAHYKVRATFFLIGSRAAEHPELVRQIYQAGHEIGNHSWSHPNLTKLAPAEVEAQVSRTQSAIMAAGVPAPHLFRPPYGAINDMVRTHVPLAMVMWNVDPEDWKEKDPSRISERIVVHAKPGAMIDLHDVHHPAADALGPAIERLLPHYNLVTVSELFNIPSGQRGEFYGR